MRLIDADALKEEIEKLCEQINAKHAITIPTSAFTHIIDNAPTVDPEITNDDLQAAMTESYHLGYELAETKFKRPQGDNKEALFVLNHLFYDCGNMTQKEYDILLEAITEADNECI